VSRNDLEMPFSKGIGIKMILEAIERKKEIR
jgi:hypothetical protein